MSFEQKDWSSYSYREVKNMLEEYRNSYTMNAGDVNPVPLNKEKTDE